MRAPRTATTLTSAGLLLGVAVLSGAGGAVAAGMVTSADIKDGTITTADVKNETLRVADINNGAERLIRGPWGYGRVQGTSVDHASPGVSVTNPAAGVFCVSVPFADATRVAATATPDYSNDSTVPNTNSAQAFVEISDSTNCADPTDFRFLTLVRTYDGAGSTDLNLTNQPFYFSVG